MAFVTLTNIGVLDNPTAFTNPFQFEVTFECIHPLEDDLEWKIIYVGSAHDENQDQILEEVLVGPIPIGTNKFVFQANPPNVKLISEEDIMGVTIVLVTCSYREKEFVRVGYYVNNDYDDPELSANPPPHVDITKLQRNILADKPRVTRFPIDWGVGNNNAATVEAKCNHPLENMENDPGMVEGLVDDDDDDDMIRAANALDAANDGFYLGSEEEDLMAAEDEEEDEEEDGMDMDEIDLEAEMDNDDDDL